MEPGTHQHTMLPGAVLGGQAASVRPPQVVTRPGAAARQASDRSQRDQLDQRFAAVLRGFVEGFACDGADFYVLNAASNELVLRSHYRKGETEPAADRRPLASARADVAAMAGSAIVLEDDVEVAGWPVPVWCGAAVCLPVASDQTIHGTVWLYSHEPRAFANAELQLAEVVAGRLAVELELDAWRSGSTGCDDPAPSSATPPVARAARADAAPAAPSIHVARPTGAPMLEEWELAGWTIESPQSLAFYDWQTLADGRTLVAAGATSDQACSANGWLQAARIALRAHAATAGDAGELLTRANHTLWLASPGGEGLAVAIALLDSDGARTSLATAGESGVARWRAAKCDWAASGYPPLGWSERAVYAPRSVDLMVRERMVLVASHHELPTAAAIERIAERLRHGTPDHLRSMPGKRALRAFADAAASVGIQPAGLAMVRRR